MLLFATDFVSKPLEKKRLLNMQIQAVRLFFWRRWVRMPFSFTSRSILFIDHNKEKPNKEEN